MAWPTILCSEATMEQVWRVTIYRFLDKLDELYINLLGTSSIEPNTDFLPPVISCLESFLFLREKARTTLTIKRERGTNRV